jgi:hypothetical protein
MLLYWLPRTTVAELTMESDALRRKSKRQREVLPTVADILVVARGLWEKSNPYKKNSAQQEDAHFRESLDVAPWLR